MNKQEKIFEAYKGTVERNLNAVQSCADLKAFGIPKNFWGRIIEELNLPKENFYKEKIKQQQ